MEETISLKEIFDVIKKRFLLIILFVVGAVLIAASVSYFVLTPIYESSSMFVVNQKKDKTAEDYTRGDIQKNIELINTYKVIIKSPAIMEKVNEELGLDSTSGQLKDQLDVSSEEDSQVVTVTASDPDPETAADIANTTANVFQDNIPDILNVDNVSILAEAEVTPDASPVSPKPLLNIAIGLALGVMSGVGFAFLLEYLDNTIKTEKDVEDRLGMPLLGVISHIDDADLQPEQRRQRVSRKKRGDHSGAQKEVN